jgi:pimeloyl-ACP methyl ester carboxylesterase
VSTIEVHDAELGRLPVRWRTAPAPEGSGAPILWLHGVPQAGEMWTPFLERAGGIAPDLPGFGRTGKPAEHPYTIGGYGRFIEDILEHLEVERVRLAMHDWGSVGLAFAQAHPERVERLALINVVPFLPGYRWHRVARLWRTRGLGELAMGFTAPWNLRRASGLPRPVVDEIFEHFDHGTQRAILRLYRSAGPEVLAAAGRALGEVTAPALVLWGDRDPYLPARFGDGLAAALGDAEVRHLPEAGHWPWLDAPEVIDLTASFLSS